MAPLVELSADGHQELVVVEGAGLLLVEGLEQQLDLLVRPLEVVLLDHLGELLQVHRAGLVVIDDAELPANADYAVSAVSLMPMKKLL